MYVVSVSVFFKFCVSVCEGMWHAHMLNVLFLRMSVLLCIHMHICVCFCQSDKLNNNSSFSLNLNRV